MTQKRKLFVSIGLTVSCIILSAAAPLVFYSSQLPSNDLVKAGANIPSLFRNFQQPFDSYIGNAEISNKIICMNCLPEQNGSSGCKALMASFVAKKLIEPESMFWHLKNAYLAKAIQIKYNDQTLAQAYFGFIAGIFHEPNIDSLCNKEFGKNCNQLTNGELVKFQRGISSGKFPPENGPTEESLQSCL